MKPLSKLARQLRRRVRVEYLTLVRPTVEIAGVRLRVGRHLSPNMRHYLYKGQYETRELDIVRGALKPDDMVMELGTGLGVLATYCAQRIGSDRVFTYEANPALEPHIRETFALNGVSPSLSTCVLGSEVGEATFYVAKEFTESSTHRRDPGMKAVTVPMGSLNAEIHRIDPAFLIADIEGGEYDLFESIDFHRIEKICVEVHEQAIGRDKVERIKAILSNAGFVLNTTLATPTVWYLSRSKLR